MAIGIDRLDPVTDERTLGDLAALLIDAVASGASIGFDDSLDVETARRFWGAVGEDVVRHRALLLGARDHEARLVGCVYLSFPPLPNGRHRAAVEKLLVLRTHRRRGIGRRLLAAVEDAAVADGRTLLFLEVREGSEGEHLYARRGWSRVGVIPGHARHPSGGFAGTAIWYLTLDRHRASAR